MVNERESMRLANLSLQCKKKTQHQLGAKSHGGTDIANDHELRLACFIAIMDLHRHAMILEIFSDGCLWVELTALGAFLAQRDPSAQHGGQSLHFALQDLFIRIR